MELPKGLVLIPGVMQDHRGKRYQYGRYPSGKCVMVEVQEPPLPAKLEAEMEHILVESKSTLLLKDEQLNEMTREKLKSGHLYQAGEVYETVRCIHESNV